VLGYSPVPTMRSVAEAVPFVVDDSGWGGSVQQGPGTSFYHEHTTRRPEPYGNGGVYYHNEL